MSPERAHVTSSEAIERFRALLIVYRDKSKPLLADAADEVSRTREWLLDRRRHWEAELRRRKRRLEDAQQALFSARFSNLREVSAAEQMALHRAERALAEAEEKLVAVKRWGTAFDHQTGPLLKHIEQLRTAATTGVAKAEEYLSRVLATLDLYVRTPLPEQAPESAPEPSEGQ
jgi:hypothetical protein